MKKIIDIAIDVETLSRKPNAAIIEIAAAPFSIDVWNEGELAGMLEEEFCFHQIVDAGSCAMYGMDFAKGTVKWWSEQSDEAKAQFLAGKAVPIREALLELKEKIEYWKDFHKADGLRVWMQGTDFDGPILRNAYIEVFNDDKTTDEHEMVPWRHDELRDSRTFVLEHMRKYHPEAEDPYSVIPKMKQVVKHNAMGDIRTLVNNVQFCENERMSNIKKQ